MILISSNRNPLIKEVKSLKNKKDRDEKGLFFVEGCRIVEEALNGNSDIAYTIVSEEFNLGGGNGSFNKKLEGLGCNNYIVPGRLFREIAETETPQGILAVIRLKRQSLIDEAIKDGLYAILDMIRDPGNMGSIIRTADAAGFTGIAVTKGCVDVYNPKVLRSTMGSLFHIPIYHCDCAIDAIKLFKLKGIKIYSSHLTADCSIYEADMTTPLALIIGSEAGGVSGAAVLQADMLVRIPMAGKAESLNASVAAGIIMYEAVRQRGGLW